LDTITTIGSITRARRITTVRFAIGISVQSARIADFSRIHDAISTHWIHTRRSTCVSHTIIIAFAIVTLFGSIDDSIATRWCFPGARRIADARLTIIVGVSLTVVASFTHFHRAVAAHRIRLRFTRRYIATKSHHNDNENYSTAPKHALSSKK